MASVTAAAQSPELFGAAHSVLLGAIGLLGALVVWGLRRVRSTSTAGTMVVTFGWVLLGSSLVYMGWMLLPANWHLDQSLPLHFSDVLRLVAAIALICRTRWAVAITYYWGLTLNLQALLTPHPHMLAGLSIGVALYWWLHILVLLAALSLVWGLGHRFQWRDFAAAYGAALAWAAVAMSANAALGTNYGFLNHSPEGPSLLDLLGPWPLYVVWLALLVAGVWALMTWPWTRPSGSAAAPPQG